MTHDKLLELVREVGKSVKGEPGFAVAGDRHRARTGFANRTVCQGNI